MRKKTKRIDFFASLQQTGGIGMVSSFTTDSKEYHLLDNPIQEHADFGRNVYIACVVDNDENYYEATWNIVKDGEDMQWQDKCKWNAPESIVSIPRGFTTIEYYSKKGKRKKKQLSMDKPSDKLAVEIWEMEDVDYYGNEHTLFLNKENLWRNYSVETFREAVKKYEERTSFFRKLAWSEESNSPASNTFRVTGSSEKENGWVICIRITYKGNEVLDYSSLEFMLEEEQDQTTVAD